MAIHSTHRRRRRVLTLSGSLLSVLITLELATRLLRPDFESVTRFDAELGMLLKPGLSQPYYDSERGQTVPMRTNSLGLRGPEYATPKPAGIRRVAVFGDSYTEARAFEERETFCGRLEELLNGDPAEQSPRWEVINAGVSGYGTSAELSLYRRKIAAFEPDIVIVCFSPGNDVQDNSVELNPAPVVRSRLDAEGRIELVPPPEVSIKRGLKNWSQFYRWQKQKLKTLADSFREKQGNPADGVVQMTLVPPPTPIERAWNLTGLLLREFQLEVESRGAEFCVVTIPHCWQIQADQFALMCSHSLSSDCLEVEYPVRRLSELCGEYQIPLLDLTASFRESYPYEDSSHSDEWLFLNGRGHFNARGHDLAAREIFQFLTARRSRDLPIEADLAKSSESATTVR